MSLRRFISFSSYWVLAGFLFLSSAATVAGVEPKLKQTVELGDGHSPNCVTFSHYRKFLALASAKAVYVYDIAAEETKASLEGNNGFVWCTAFNPTGKLVATANGDTAVLWDVATEKPLIALDGNKQSVDSVAFSSDG